MSEELDQIKGLLVQYVEDRNAHLAECQPDIDELARKMRRPVDLSIAVTCSGKLSFFSEDDCTAEDFTRAALIQALMGGEHLLGFFKAHLVLTDWNIFTSADYEDATSHFIASKVAELESFAELLEATEQKGDDL